MLSSVSKFCLKEQNQILMLLVTPEMINLVVVSTEALGGDRMLLHSPEFIPVIFTQLVSGHK